MPSSLLLQLLLLYLLLLLQWLALSSWLVLAPHVDIVTGVAMAAVLRRIADHRAYDLGRRNAQKLKKKPRTPARCPWEKRSTGRCHRDFLLFTPEKLTDKAYLLGHSWDTLPSRGSSRLGTRPGGSVTGVTEKIFMCQMFICVFWPLTSADELPRKGFNSKTKSETKE